MKRRLLVPLSVLMLSGNAEWMQATALDASELFPVRMEMPMNMGLPAVQAANMHEATVGNISDIIEKAADGDIISLEAGEYKDITINKRISLLVNGTAVTLNNVTMTASTPALKTTPTVGYGMVILQGNGSCTVNRGTYINNVSGSSQDSGSNASYIFAMDEGATGTLTIKNAQLTLGGTNQRAIGNRNTSSSSTIALTNTTIAGTLTATGAYNNTIGIYCADLGQVTMAGGSITNVKYGVQVGGNGQKVKLAGTASITAWGAIYLYQATSAAVEVESDVTLTGKTCYSNATETSANDFGAIVFEGGATSTVTSSGTIQNAYAAGATAKQYPILFSNKNAAGGHKVALNGGKVVTTDEKTPFLIGYNESNNTVTKGTAQFLYKDATCTLISNASGFKNAIISVDKGLEAVEAGDTLTVPANTVLKASIDKEITIAGAVKLAGEGMSVKKVTFKNEVAVTANAATIDTCKFEKAFSLKPVGTSAASYVLSRNKYAGTITAEGAINDAQAIGGIKSAEFPAKTNVLYTRVANGKNAYVRIVSVDALNKEFIANCTKQTIINASSLNSKDVLIQLNTLSLSVGDLPAIVCQDVFMRESSSAAAAPAGLTIKTYTKPADSIVLELAVKIAVDLTNITATTIEAGQTLSLSKITGTAKAGEVVVAGTFAWSNPGEIATEGTGKSFDIIFTPADPLNYKSVISKATIGKIVQYYTLTPTVATNGQIVIEGKTADNRYPKGTTIKVAYKPDTDYKVVAKTAESINLQKNDTVKATFEKIKQKVMIAAQGGTLNVTLNGQSISSGADIERGSVLVVTAVPNANNVLQSLTSNNVAITKGTIVVGNSDVNLSAAFVAKPVEKHLVKVETKNGRVTLLHDGKQLNSGAAVAENAVITAMAIPNTGYEFDGFDNDTDKKVQKDFTVGSGDLTITAKFRIKQYAVSTKISEEGTSAATISVTSGNVSVTSGTLVNYGEECIVKVTERKADYRLISMLINGKEVAVPATEAEGVSFKVEGATEITLVVAKRAAITLNNDVQAYTYDNKAKGFALKMQPSGLTGFTVLYKAKDARVDFSATQPITAGEYDVKITRPADNTYMAVDKTSTLTIKKAVLGVPVPEIDDNGSLKSADCLVDGKKVGVNVALSIPSLGLPANEYVPTDENNYAKEEFSVVVSLKDAKPVTIERAEDVNRSLKSANLQTRAAEEEPKKLTLNYDPTLGSLVILNSTAELTNVYKGQTVTIKAIPFDGVKSDVSLTGGTGGTEPGVVTVILDDNRAITATFVKKGMLETKSISETKTYSGAAFGGGDAPQVSDTDVKDWNISYVAGEKSYSVPVEAGEYSVKVSRPEDGEYLPVEEKTIGTYTIKQAGVTVDDIKATPLMEGDDITMSQLSGRATAAGTFDWVIQDGESLVKYKNEQQQNDGTFTKEWPISFKLNDDKNYIVTTAEAALTADVTVTKAAVEQHYVTLNFDETKGSATFMINDVLVQNGTPVTAGQKIKVLPSANQGYEVDQVTVAPVSQVTKVTGEDNVWTVNAGINVDLIITVTFKQSSTPPTPGGDVDVTGISLATTTKTLNVGESFTLVATVSPNNATNKDITWSSSDPTVATVDNAGKVTAVKNGTATITATTNDGGYAATCEVTVSGSVGIEDILTDTRVYARNGDIYIEPSEALQVEVANTAGYRFFTKQITETTPVKVFPGVYFVKLTTSEGSVVKKVIVR